MSNPIRRLPQSAFKLSVIKRSGQAQPFSSVKLTRSIIKAGATQQQANVVTNRVISGLPTQKTVTTKELSTMTAHSLSKINTAASSNYTAYRNQKAVPKYESVGTVPISTARSSSIIRTRLPNDGVLMGQNVNQNATIGNSKIFPIKPPTIEPNWMYGGGRGRISYVYGEAGIFPTSRSNYIPGTFDFPDRVQVFLKGGNVEDKYFFEVFERSKDKIGFRVNWGTHPPTKNYYGDTYVGYGFPGTEVKFDQWNRIVRQPEILSISPQEFTQGDIVTIEGFHLSYLQPWKIEDSLAVAMGRPQGDVDCFKIEINGRLTGKLYIKDYKRINIDDYEGSNGIKERFQFIVGNGFNVDWRQVADLIIGKLVYSNSHGFNPVKSPQIVFRNTPPPPKEPKFYCNYCCKEFEDNQVLTSNTGKTYCPQCSHEISKR